ncbi:hypothetical protein DPMN_012294 [Dreissena polymorpha]|uniref:Uncharacterized protein n=1 Tax=Dreissena polymorpha TaxID=45954 RepID=A0A9D4N250_DREPO|nr:hypothetical protein DPMN_012294 [Dreissena polymorpha]
MPKQSPGECWWQCAGLLMYRSYTGTLLAFTGAPPGHHRQQPGRCCSSAGVCMGQGEATVPSGLFSVPYLLFPVPRQSLPVLPGDSQFIPEVLNISVLTRWSLDPPRWSPGLSRIMHRGSTGIIVRLGL